MENNNKLNSIGRIAVPIDNSLDMITVLNYTKKFKKFTANKDVSFSVRKGVIHGFIGPNGSGKTTTIKSLIGAYTVEEGKMLINQYEAGSIKAKKLIGYIPEKNPFPSNLTCEKYLVEMAILSGLSKSYAKIRVKEILKSLGFEDFAKMKPATFSSGMQKKIMLAQALISDPPILIMDEPAANLDPTARKMLQDDLIRLRNEGKTILVSSHILSELEKIIDEATFLYYGKVLFSGTVEDLKEKIGLTFLKTDDNDRVRELLEKEGIKDVVYDKYYQEIQIPSKNSETVRKVMNIVSSNKIDISYIKTSDLQKIYDKLVEEAFSNNEGNQSYGDKKVISNKKDASTITIQDEVL